MLMLSEAKHRRKLRHNQERHQQPGEIQRVQRFIGVAQLFAFGIVHGREKNNVANRCSKLVRNENILARIIKGDLMNHSIGNDGFWDWLCCHRHHINIGTRAVPVHVKANSGPFGCHVGMEVIHSQGSLGFNQSSLFHSYDIDEGEIALGDGKQVHVAWSKKRAVFGCPMEGKQKGALRSQKALHDQYAH